MPDGSMEVIVSHGNGATLRGTVPAASVGVSPFPVLRDATLSAPGVTFVGDVTRHEFCGHVLVTFQQGGGKAATYAGEMSAGAPHGEGTLTTEDYALAGTWQQGQVEGTGTLRFDDPAVVGAEWVTDATKLEERPPPPPVLAPHAAPLPPPPVASRVLRPASPIVSSRVSIFPPGSPGSAAATRIIERARQHARTRRTVPEEPDEVAQILEAMRARASEAAAPEDPEPDAPDAPDAPRPRPIP